MIRAAISRLVMGLFPRMGEEAWHVSDLPYVSIPDALSYNLGILEHRHWITTNASLAVEVSNKSYFGISIAT